MQEIDLDPYFEKPYWIADILPARVPEGSQGQYFKVEEWYLEPDRLLRIRRKYTEIFLKLCCYFDAALNIVPGEVWTEDPEPEELVCKMQEAFSGNQTVNFLIPSEHTLFTLNADDTYMTVYGPTERVMELLKPLVLSEGLFLWKPE